MTYAVKILSPAETDAVEAELLNDHDVFLPGVSAGLKPRCK